MTKVWDPVQRLLLVPVVAIVFIQGPPGLGQTPAAAVQSPVASRTATLLVHASEKSPYSIPKYITGKFAEHLGNNIYNGMSAQILRNPTFADYPFATGENNPDGVVTFHFEREKISEAIRRSATRFGWPEAALDSAVEDYFDGLACGWARIGSRTDVEVSPDTAPFGQRAQRVEVRTKGGLGQWTFLPDHRTHTYEFEIYLRSPDMETIRVSLDDRSSERLATAEVRGIQAEWRTFSGKLELPKSKQGDKEPQSYWFAITADGPGQLVIGRVLLRPADHIQGADSDVVRFLRDSKLPILRWPGGNFVSSYHWEDGVGPVEQRPTKPNYAWGAVEPNLFGTDEFIAFCRAVGCEPMICVNAGSGTPEEAARWIEYCNGPPTSPMGKLRADNGHPEPYRLHFWEIGNELWGRWQYFWTSASGYVDRYKQFAKAMRAADPGIELMACGAPVMWGKAWNDTLIAGLGPSLEVTTDHPLVGGDVHSDVFPLDVFRDFMAVPGVLERKWADLRDQMTRAGVHDPRLAVTELQLFAHLRDGSGADEKNPSGRLTRDTLVHPATQAEALYDVLIYHAAVRLLPFVEMVTQSAIVNHGGGLRKERERVYANPCHYAQSAFADFAEAAPVAIELDVPNDRAPLVLLDLKQGIAPARELTFRTVDAVAAVGKRGELLISIVNALGATSLEITLDGWEPGGPAEITRLSAETPWTTNTLANPEVVKPVRSTAEIKGGKLLLELPAYSVVALKVPAAR